MIISIIAAMDSNNVIGGKNKMLWHLPADLMHFKDVTKGHCVIMGRKTYDSIPEKHRPLPDRTNIIITTNKEFVAPNCEIADSITHALAIALRNKEEECFIIGGSQIYQQSMHLADRFYLTKIDHAFPGGDSYFPEFSNDKFRTVSSKQFNDKFSFEISIFERIKDNSNPNHKTVD